MAILPGFAAAPEGQREDSLFSTLSDELNIWQAVEHYRKNSTHSVIQPMSRLLPEILKMMEIINSSVCVQTHESINAN